MTKQQDFLQLFVGLTAIAAVLMGVGGLIGYARLGNVAGQAVFLSPYFAAVVIFCGLLLYVARLFPRHVPLFALLALAALAFSHWASQWSAAWANGRAPTAHFTHLLILTGLAAVIWWWYSSRHPRHRPSAREVATGFLGVALSTFISFVLIEENILTRQTFAERSAEVVATNVGDRTARAEALIQRLTGRWSAIHHMPERSFMEEEFRSYLRDFDFFLSLHLVDESGAVVLEQSRGTSLERLASRQEMQGLLNQAHESGRILLVIREDSASNKNLGVFVSPLYNPEMERWSVIASIDLAGILTWAMTRMSDGGYFYISHSNNILYQSADAPPPSAIAAGDITIPVHDDFELNLYYAYSPEATDLGTEVWAEFVWLSGVIVTFLLIASQRLTTIARKRTHQLSYNALHDPLTGLPNRRQLEQTLAEACTLASRDGQAVSVVFFDLDGIKLINDSVGHDVGDEVLIEAARRLQEGVSGYAAVHQLGNDEFVLLFKGVGAGQVKARTEALIRELSSPYHIAGRVLAMTANAGIVNSDCRVDDPMELVRQADLAMLRAKRAGRNSLHTYTPDLSAEVAERLELVHDLQVALDSGWLELRYQPIVQDGSWQVVGAEALLRWQHERHGYISPARFVPLAEETGQIVALTDWVLTSACRDSALLREQGLPAFPIAVNISPLYFQRPDFIERVKRILRELELPAEFIELEITEGVLVDDEKAAIQKLSELRDMGIKTSIDDFGTGYSSLSYLKNLPIDKVKIDRSFIIDIVNRSADAAIVQGIIYMAHHLGLSVVAEGVETEPQLSFLRHNRCDAFQGYLYSQPQTLDQLLGTLGKTDGRLLPSALLPSQAELKDGGQDFTAP